MFDKISKWWNEPTVAMRLSNPSLPAPQGNPIRPELPKETRKPIFPENDEVLATLYAETQNQSPQGMLGVFNTIQNRSIKKSQPWTDTVSAPGQYTGYGDANYQQALQQAKGVETLTGRSLSQYETMRRMMEEQAQGQDTTDGATHYYNPVKQAELHKLRPELYPTVASFLTNWKAVNQPEPIFTKKIDDHEFYRNIAPYR